MFHRFSTWWRALSVVLLCLATMAWPTAARAGTTPSFTLLHQDAVATVTAKGTRTSPFAFDVAREYPFARTGHDLPRVIDRSQLAPIVAGIGTTQKPLGTTSAFTLKCETHGQYKFTVNLYSRRPEASRRTCAPAPRLHFPARRCAVDGVYPIRIEVTTNATTTMQWSLLAVQSTPVESRCASNSLKRWTRMPGFTRNAPSPYCISSRATLVGDLVSATIARSTPSLSRGH